AILCHMILRTIAPGLVLCASSFATSSISAAETGAWGPGPTLPEALTQITAVVGPDQRIYLFGGDSLDSAEVDSSYAFDPILLRRADAHAVRVTGCLRRTR